MSNYFNDVRDRFDALYETAASFVRLPTTELLARPHIMLCLDLESEIGSHSFRLACYAYEDSYDWNALPMLYKAESSDQRVEWVRSGSITSAIKAPFTMDAFESTTSDFAESAT